MTESYGIQYDTSSTATGGAAVASPSSSSSSAWSIWETRTFTKVSVILSVGLLLNASALLTIAVILKTRSLRNVMGFYLLSLATVDLLCSILIIPASLYSAIVPEWHFMHNNSPSCKCSAFIEAALIVNAAYTYSWIGVDRYAALKRPQRYETEQTLTKCICWIIFTWVASTLLPLPILITSVHVNFNEHIQLCIFDLSNATYYFVTLAMLTIVPSILTVTFTYFCIFKAMRNHNKLEDAQRMILETDQNFPVAVFILLTFCLSWIPLITAPFLKNAFESSADAAIVSFAFVWFAIAGPSSKLLVLVMANREFQAGFCSLCYSICRCCLCRRGAQQKDEYCSIAGVHYQLSY